MINPIDSILTVKASGVDINVDNDLSMPIGKSIAELLYEEEENNQKDPQNQDQKTTP